MSQFDDIDEAYVPFTAFNTTHIIPVKIGQLRQLFLREPPLQTKLAEPVPENLPRVRSWHRAIIEA